MTIHICLVFILGIPARRAFSEKRTGRVVMFNNTEPRHSFLIWKSKPDSWRFYYANYRRTRTLWTHVCWVVPFSNLSSWFRTAIMLIVSGQEETTGVGEWKATALFKRIWGRLWWLTNGSQLCLWCPPHEWILKGTLWTGFGNDEVCLNSVQQHCFACLLCPTTRRKEIKVWRTHRVLPTKVSTLCSLHV